MLLGCSRPVAAEFSFFLAIPVMFGASLLKSAKYAMHIASGEVAMITGSQVTVLVIGMAVAFIVSIAAIKYELCQKAQF